MAKSSLVRRPTIADVAELAGVSKGAVSRTFNGGGRISEATTLRIRAAAAQLGWTPNVAARAMNGAPARAVGLVLRRPAELLELDPFFPAFLAGVESVLAQNHYAAVLRFVGDAKEERACYQQMVAERRVDGFLINDLRRRDTRYAMVGTLDTHAVVVGTPPVSCPLPSVDSDSDDQLTELMQRFLQAGHRTIAHVTGSPDLVHSQSRQALWKSILVGSGATPGPLAIGHFTAAGGAAATREVMKVRPRPTAIFYANDLMAVAGLAALADLGLRVPDDVAVAGFDDSSIASYTSPALTTVHCDYRNLGRRAAELLLASIAGERVDHRVTLSAELRLRASTGALASVDLSSGARVAVRS